MMRSGKTLKQMKLIDKVKSNKVLIAVIYLFSILLLMISSNYDIYYIWLLGPLIISIFIDKILGGLSVFNFIIILSLFFDNGSNYITLNLIIGITICILSNYIIDIDKVGYILIIMISTIITLTTITNNFFITGALNVNTLYSSVGIAIVIFIGYIIHTSFGSSYKYYMNIQRILDDEYELLHKLHGFSEPLFEHSLKVAEISCQAALFLGADVKTVRAGSLYHEIGRITGKNHISEGIKLANEHEFPKKVVSIIRQHNSSYEKPSSVEATIVMLSDSIISTFDYLEGLPKNSNKKEFAKDKIIQDIFRIRYTNGAIANSGISIETYNSLEKFYMLSYQ